MSFLSRLLTVLVTSACLLQLELYTPRAMAETASDTTRSDLSSAQSQMRTEASGNTTPTQLKDLGSTSTTSVSSEGKSDPERASAKGLAMDAVKGDEGGKFGTAETLVSEDILKLGKLVVQNLALIGIAIAAGTLLLLCKKNVWRVLSVDIFVAAAIAWIVQEVAFYLIYMLTSTKDAKAFTYDPNGDKKNQLEAIKKLKKNTGTLIGLLATQIVVYGVLGAAMQAAVLQAIAEKVSLAVAKKKVEGQKKALQALLKTLDAEKSAYTNSNQFMTGAPQYKVSLQITGDGVSDYNKILDVYKSMDFGPEAQYTKADDIAIYESMDKVYKASETRKKDIEHNQTIDNRQAEKEEKEAKLAKEKAETEKKISYGIYTGCLKAAAASGAGTVSCKTQLMDYEEKVVTYQKKNAEYQLAQQQTTAIKSAGEILKKKIKVVDLAASNLKKGWNTLKKIRYHTLLECKSIAAVSGGKLDDRFFSQPQVCSSAETDPAASWWRFFSLFVPAHALDLGSLTGGSGSSSSSEGGSSSGGGNNIMSMISGGDQGGNSVMFFFLSAAATAIVLVIIYKTRKSMGSTWIRPVTRIIAFEVAAALTLLAIANLVETTARAGWRLADYSKIEARIKADIKKEKKSGSGSGEETEPTPEFMMPTTASSGSTWDSEAWAAQAGSIPMVKAELDDISKGKVGCIKASSAGLIGERDDNCECVKTNSCYQRDNSAGTMAAAQAMKINAGDYSTINSGMQAMAEAYARGNVNKVNEIAKSDGLRRAMANVKKRFDSHQSMLNKAEQKLGLPKTNFEEERKKLTGELVAAVKEKQANADGLNDFANRSAMDNWNLPNKEAADDEIDRMTNPEELMKGESSGTGSVGTTDLTDPSHAGKDGSKNEGNDADLFLNEGGEGEGSELGENTTAPADSKTPETFLENTDYQQKTVEEKSDVDIFERLSYRYRVIFGKKVQNPSH